ncbi:2-hydroxyacid dehydrogenase [Parvibaculum sedimenti]|uniref:2-hydroxyacid dehydrogenase n=1 Tax=Parvibaculum sedimenti TaxID=2608632 RepID=A0A6N6VJT8_9HYPH|nr:NAD(P)-dependent oxidoreductase [Parvibaculum sedimenti]KAB7739202.1 2-hydroxyacid dehydrogenase [Parvibaculum sedimenti]
MKPSVFLAIPLGKAFQDQLSGKFTLIADPAQRHEAEAILLAGASVTSVKEMDEMPKLRIIACIGSGYEGIDVAEATRRGIKVTNTVGANAAAVADLAVALLLASIRHVATGDRLMRAGLWRGDGAARLLFSPGLTGRKIGIVGLGAIGEKIAARLAAFETEIGYYGRNKRNASPYRYFETPLALATWADALVLAHRADESNRHLVNAELIEALGPRGHIVNITRGSVIDEEALVAALKSGKLAGAGLDVFEGEPDHIRADLRELPNVVLTPHLGGASVEALQSMLNAAIANLDAFFAGRPLPAPVTA